MFVAFHLVIPTNLVLLCLVVYVDMHVRTNSMHEQFRLAWEIVVNDIVQHGNINTSRLNMTERNITSIQ